MDLDDILTEVRRLQNENLRLQAVIDKMRSDAIGAVEAVTSATHALTHLAREGALSRLAGRIKR